MFNEVVIGECENSSFQNLASHAASSSRRKERLVSLLVSFPDQYDAMFIA